METSRIEEIYGLLSATVAQLAPSDDQIISDNIKKAQTLVREEMREQRRLTHRCDWPDLARLIASAPELLEALENAEFLLRKLAINPREIGRMTDSLKRAGDDMRAAIARATQE